MKEFVMGDIHGGYKALVQCLERSGFDSQNDTLIQLGDIVDGYDQVYECVEALLAIKKRILVKGNHDDWLASFFNTDFHPVFWNYGGKATLQSYLRHAGKEGQFFATRTGFKSALVAGDIPARHRSFFDSQVLYHVGAGNRLFVHAGLNRHLALERQKSEDFYWDRTLWAEALHTQTYNRHQMDTAAFFKLVDFSEIFIGHTPTTKLNTDQPLRALNVINVDTGAGYSGRLTIMDVATKQYWQSDPLPTLYPEQFDRVNVFNQTEF